MKLFKYMASIAIISIISITITACTETAVENCEQQDMNEILNCDEEKNVEVCCETGAICIYKYAGQDYPDTEAGLNDLADALGCTYKSSENMDLQKELIIKNLKALRERAWLGAN